MTHNNDENQILHNIAESYLREVAQYQPPPMAQAPPAQIQQSNQPAPEARQAPTAGQKAPAAKNKSYFDSSNLANRLGMKAGGDQASVVVDGIRGIVHRMNDGIPRRVHLGRDGRTGMEFVSGEKSFRAANPAKANAFRRGKFKKDSGMYRHSAIEDDARGVVSQDFLDQIENPNLIKSGLTGGVLGNRSDVHRRGSPAIQAQDNQALANYQQALRQKADLGITDRNYKSKSAPNNFIRGGRGY